jgi:deazaflavin-dependent oxidoreductase (nitroreductase family)
MAITTPQRLSQVAKRWTLRLTHYGRKTGKAYQVTIWFLVEGETVYLVTQNMQRQWTRNVQARPEVQLQIGNELWKGEVAVITDQTEQLHVVDLMLQKYWIVRPYVWLQKQFAARRPGEQRGRGGAFRVRLRAASTTAS